jgi:hypothetical protein
VKLHGQKEEKVRYVRLLVNVLQQQTIAANPTTKHSRGGDTDDMHIIDDSRELSSETAEASPHRPSRNVSLDNVRSESSEQAQSQSDSDDTT